MSANGGGAGPLPARVPAGTGRRGIVFKWFHHVGGVKLDEKRMLDAIISSYPLTHVVFFRAWAGPQLRSDEPAGGATA